MNTALILIDIQNDYFANGKMTLIGSDVASLNAKRVLEYFRNKNNLIVHIQHVSSRKDATFFLPNSMGVEIHRSVTPLTSEKIITKQFPNAFQETALFQYLSDNHIKNLAVAGMMTHMCVDATVRGAKDLGFSIDLIADACATKPLEINGKAVSAEDVQTAFVAALNYYYATIHTTDAYLARANLSTF